MTDLGDESLASSSHILALLCRKGSCSFLHSQAVLWCSERHPRNCPGHHKLLQASQGSKTSSAIKHSVGQRQTAQGSPVPFTEPSQPQGHSIPHYTGIWLMCQGRGVHRPNHPAGPASQAFQRSKWDWEQSKTSCSCSSVPSDTLEPRAGLSSLTQKALGHVCPEGSTWKSI